MAAFRGKRIGTRTEFFDLFLKIAKCPYRSECKSDFEELDIDVRPQGGFMGSNYEKGRVLIIGQNPGGGRAARGNLGALDDHYYDQVEELLKSESKSMFLEFMNYLENDFMPKWPLFRNFNPERYWGIGISHLALINAVHCRTINDSTPNMEIAMRCFSAHTLKQIDILDPKLIICFGKKTYDFLCRLYQNPSVPIKYVLHPSGQYTKQHPDIQTNLVNEIQRHLRASDTKLVKTEAKERPKVISEKTRKKSVMKWSHQTVYNGLVKKGNYEKKGDKNKYISLNHHRLGNLDMVLYRSDTESYGRAPLHMNDGRPGFSEDLFTKISPAIDYVSHGGHGWKTYRIIDWGKLAEGLGL